MPNSKPILRSGTIVAIGGSWTYADDKAPLGFLPILLRYVRSPRARILHIGTPSQDSSEKDTDVRRFFGNIESSLVESISTLSLTPDQTDFAEAEQSILGSDVIFVSSGNTAAALDIWRRTGVDTYLKQAWKQGTVCAGSSAGALCWFERFVTDSFGAPQIIDGLGLLPGIACAHYDSFTEGRALLLSALVKNEAAVGYGISDASAIVFRDGTVKAENLGSFKSYRLALNGSRRVRIEELPTD